MNFSENKFLKTLLTLIVIAIVGIIHLPYPFFGDQAFFLLGAKEMNQGLIIYKDFWDIKQPGIFYFYLLGGKLFGFTEVGIHLFELILWLVFSVMLIWFLNKFVFQKSKFYSYYATALFVITYYICSGTGKFTQVEILATIPLLMVIIFNTLYLKESKNRMLWLFLSGISSGIILFLKIIFLPIIGCFYLLTFIRSIEKIKEIPFRILQFLVIILGIVVIWAPFIWFCYKNNIADLVYRSFFIIPPQVIQYAEHKSLYHLYQSAMTFFPRIVLLLPLFIYGAVSFRKNPFVTDMIIWFLVSSLVVLIQRTSWWGYHFLLLYPPIIFLSVFGVMRIIRSGILQKIKPLSRLNKMSTALLFVACINSPLFLMVGYKIYKLSQFSFAQGPSARKNYILDDRFNKRALEIADVINSTNHNKEIFVAGDPLIYYYSGTIQATAQNGWSIQFYIPEQWKMLADELKEKKPEYVYIDSIYYPYFEKNGKAISDWLNTDYTLINSSENGKWYQRN